MRIKSGLQNRNIRVSWILLLVASLITEWELRLQVLNLESWILLKENKIIHMPTDLCCGYKGFSLFLKPLQLTVKQLTMWPGWQSLFFYFFKFSADPLPLPKIQQLSFTSLSSFGVFRKLLFHIFQLLITSTSGNVFLMCFHETRT